MKTEIAAKPKSCVGCHVEGNAVYYSPSCPLHGENLSRELRRMSYQTEAITTGKHNTSKR